MHKVFFGKISAALRLCFLFLLFFSASHAQRLAIVVPEKGELAESVSRAIAENISGKVKILDPSMADTAFRALDIGTPFNMTVGDARRTADAIGCDFVLLVRAYSTRRTSLVKGSYFETYAIFYLVSERSGQLIFWDLISFESDDHKKAENSLVSSLKQRSGPVPDKLKTAEAREISEKASPPIEQMPMDYTPKDETFRPPIPYRRIKPEYTPQARAYGIAAVVEVEADIEADGRVSRTEVVRWAGFGLDESAVEAVRKMNWRPAERNGKPLAMRVLLRYNFTRIEKD